MLHEMIPSLPSDELAFVAGSRSLWVYYPQGLRRRPAIESELCPDGPLEKQRLLPHHCNGCKSEMNDKVQDTAFYPRHALFQELFFFCTVKNVGDVPGTGCIYVETVVDSDSGVAFAKVYSTKHAMNAVDILATRVVPFFKEHGVAIEAIYTRKTSEYCGLPPMHPFETFLATSHIQHLQVDESSQPYNALCEQFYQILLKEFFPPALRKKFHLSLDELQKDLDAFIETYNSERMSRDRKTEGIEFPC